jgi:hypothetical protein
MATSGNTSVTNGVTIIIIIIIIIIANITGKAIPLQAWKGPQDPRSLRFSAIKTIGT